MIDPRDLVAKLSAEGVSLYCGVPDSLLKAFNTCVGDSESGTVHVISANEGNAVGLAIGHYLRTGTPALVYLQNSGLGNVVNPLTSLADPEIYGIPMILLIGWRGQPGVPDEPQHRMMGRITSALLNSLKLPWSVLPEETEKACKEMGEAVSLSLSSKTPYAFLVEKGSFTTVEPKSGAPVHRSPSREEALVKVADALGPDCVVVSSTGMLSRELVEYRERTGSSAAMDFTTVGGMGHASSIALGIAMNEPELEVWCLDGDGSLLMHMGALPVIAQHAPRTFFHVVFNNGVHDSVGGQPTSINQVDLPALARSAGYKYAATLSSLDDFPGEMTALRAVGGPTLLEIRVQPGNRADLGRPRSEPAQSTMTIMRALTERARS